MVWGDADQDRHHWVHWEHPLCRAIFWGSLGASPLVWNILGSRYSPGRHIPKVREDIRTSTVVASPFGILYNLLLPSQAPPVPPCGTLHSLGPSKLLISSGFKTIFERFGRRVLGNRVFADTG